MRTKLLIALIGSLALAACNTPFNADLFQYVGEPLPTYPVTYDANGGSGPPVDQTQYQAGHTVVARNIGGMSFTFNMFGGWNTSVDGSGVSFMAGETFAMLKGGITLYAQWLQVTGTTLNYIPQNLTRLVIPAGVTTLGPTFGTSPGYPNLMSVTIPSSVTSITSQGFINCPSLQTFILSGANPNYSVLNGALVQTAGNLMLAVPAKLAGAFSIPSGVTVNPYAFSYCANLTSISIPASMTILTGNIFSGMSSQIPLIIPSTVVGIDQYAFYNCGFTAVTIPASVTSIGSGGIAAFSFNTYLTTINMLGTVPPTLAVSSDFGAGVTINVPSGFAATYQAAPLWIAYTAQIF